MNFKGTFRQLGTHDISTLKEKILKISDEDWDAENWRQKHYDVHVNTHTISLIFDRDFRHKNPTVLPLYDAFKDDLAPIIAKINTYYGKMLKYKRLIKKNGNGYAIRINFVKLDPAGGDIAPHVDNLYTLSHAHRVHIPIITNEKVEFFIGDDVKNLKEGEVWEVNNRQMHSVVNNSDFYRVHIIIDWVIPGERCCCGQRLSPKGTCGPTECKATDQVLEACSCYS